jgi:hypothetical protein
MKTKPTQPPDELAAPSCSAKTCDKCDYWTLRGMATPPQTVYGYCDLFHKLTESKHGLKCTGWTPRNQPNKKISDG